MDLFFTFFFKWRIKCVRIICIIRVNFFFPVLVETKLYWMDLFLSFFFKWRNKCIRIICLREFFFFLVLVETKLDVPVSSPFFTALPLLLMDFFYYFR